MAGTTGTPMIGVVTKIDGYTIEQVEKLPVPVGKIGKIPITNQDSGYATENMPGRYDPGDTQLSGIYASKTGINRLKTWQNDRVIHSFEVDLPDGTIITFNAYLGTFTIVETSERATYQIDVSVLGVPTYTESRTALTTPFFAVSGAGTTLLPVASATPGTFIVNVANGVSSVTVTPTCATANTTIYVDDVAVTSGQASASKSLTAGTITECTIKVVESGKADAYYLLLLARASS